MTLPKVSVVLTARNEWPLIMGTLYSFHEELELWGYPHEFVVVDNLSTDHTSLILRDRMRRWVKSGLLRVVEYREKPANVLVRNLGAEAASADSEVVILADAHLSVTPGTLHGMIQGWSRHGGLWHTATNIWGDTSDIRCLGYRLKLEEKFWGDLSRAIPDYAAETSDRTVPDGLESSWGDQALGCYKVPMASHCMLLAGRQEYLGKRGYHPGFRCYGGGEPYLDLKWWLTGGEVWIEPRGLVRHAFGHRALWRKQPAEKAMGRWVYVKDEGLRKVVPAGGEFLHYARGYSWTNEQLHHNFMLAAYTVGGYPWLERMYRVYWEKRKGNPRYLDDLKDLRRDVLREGTEDRRWIETHSVCTLDSLIETEPWRRINVK